MRFQPPGENVSSCVKWRRFPTRRWRASWTFRSERLASGALPPAFAPIEIDGECYWDGGIVSNTPLWYAVDHSPPVNVLIVQVDLFSAEGELPKNLDQVMERHKDIMYSSKARFDVTHVREVQHQRGALRRLLEKIPARLKADPDVKMLKAAGRCGHID